MEAFSKSGFVGAFSGKTALIAGNGPSLACYPKEFYESFPLSIGVNTIAETFTPKFIFNIENPPFKWNHVRNPDQMGIPWITADYNIGRVNADWWVKLDLSNRGEFYMNRRAYNNQCACSYMSTFGALHMAYIMGAVNIYMIGVDFCRGQEGERYAGTRGPETGDKFPWYLHDDNVKYIETLSWFSLAFAKLTGIGIKVYDLSPYGKLRDIPKSDGKNIEVEKVVVLKEKTNPLIEVRTASDPIEGGAKVEKKNRCVILGTGPGVCCINPEEIFKIGPIFALNGAACIGSPDYAIITHQKHLTLNPKLATVIDRYGKRGGYVFMPHPADKNKFSNMKKYGGLCIFKNTASMKEVKCDPSSGFHYENSSGIMAIQIVQWMGFDEAVMIGFDGKLYDNGYCSFGDNKTISRKCNEQVGEILATKKKALEKYIKSSKIKVFSPAWSKLMDTGDIKIEQRKLKMVRIEEYENKGRVVSRKAAIKNKRPPLVSEGRKAMPKVTPRKRANIEREIVDFKKVALFSPGRECAVQDQFDGIANGLKVLGYEVKDFYDNAGIEPYAHQLKPFDLAIICPQINGQRHGMDKPGKAVFDLAKESGCSVVMLLPDEPYETGWYDKVAILADAVWTNEESCSQRIEKGLYYPLTSNSAVHKGMDVEEKYRSDVCFVGGFDRRAFNRRRRYFENLKDVLDREENLFIGANVLEIGYEKARVVNGRVTNSEIAKYYAGAKIVLNIHRDGPESSTSFFNREGASASHINPRTFEIASCRAFQLVDDTRLELKKFFPNMVTFDSPEKLRELINKYLPDNEGRARIVNGCKNYYHESILASTIEETLKVIGKKGLCEVSIVAGPFVGNAEAEKWVKENRQDAEDVVVFGAGFQERNESGATYVNENSKDIGSGFNKAFRKTSGKYVLLCPPDIGLAENAVKNMRDKIIRKKDAAFVYGHHRLGNRIVLTREFDREQILRMNYIGEVVMVRAEAYRDMEKLKRFTMWDWLIELSECGEIGVVVDEVLHTADRQMDFEMGNQNFQEAYLEMKSRRGGMPRILFR